MAKRCIFVDPRVAAVDIQPPIDWGKCLLCQQQSKESLVDPAKSLRTDKLAGYDFFANILPHFDELGELPPHLVLSRIDKGDGLVAALTDNGSKWHKSCRNKFSMRELARKRNCLGKRIAAKTADLVEPSEHAVLEEFSKKRICTRSECDSENPLRAEKPVCFFCDLPAGAQKLHDVASFAIDKRVKECALALSDNRLLSKLATGDMIALEAKYHSHCLAQFYNRRRSIERERYRELCMPDSESVSCLVFAQLTAYINDVRSVEGLIPVFKLVDLKKLYIDRLQQLDPSTVHTVNTLNSTHLKEKLLDYFPDMSAHADGRNVVLTFDYNLGTVLSQACSYDLDEDAVHLAKAAEIVRRDMFNHAWQFQNSFQGYLQEQSVPQSLLFLVRMILEGPSIDIQLQQQHSTAAVSIAQLMVFNSVRHKRTSTNRISTTVRHAKEQETPLPLYIGLAVHAATRKKRLVDKLFNIGVCVSYDRVLSVLTELASGVCDRFELDNAVCPSNCRLNIFTTAAVDNLDHNPSATTSHNSFHGTGISLHQHPDSTMLGTTRGTYDGATCTAEKVEKHAVCLPLAYTFVPPCKLLQQEPPAPSSCVTAHAIASIPGSQQVHHDGWLKAIWNSWESGTFHADCENAASSWSAYHAEEAPSRPTTQHLAVCGMLPLFHEHAQSVSMIRHAMDIVRASVIQLNPSQIPVIAFDQPLFMLAKLIQWNWPDSHGETHFVVMFGGLHIEMAALKALGALLTGSGWVEAITDAGIISAGSAEGLLSASHVRRCRRLHEVTLAALYILQHTAYQNMCDSECMPFDQWCEEQCRQQRQFAFWSSVMQLQRSILTFVRSLRESNFASYVTSLADLMPWFFVLDRINYARWLSVHVRDMQELAYSHPEIYSEFQKGKFTINKTGKKFSALPIDQVHEQLNSVVKGDGGIIGLTENETALNRWVVSGPEVARLLCEFESGLMSNSLSGPHHEQNIASQQAFVSDVLKLVNSIQRMGNPFHDQHDLIVLHNRTIVTAEVADSAGKLFNIGKQQYQQFVNNRLNTRSESLFAPLKKNKLAFFVKSKTAMMSKLKSKISASRNDSALFSRLYIACQIRNSDLNLFFSHENQIYPPALCVSGDLHFGCKSDLLACLEASLEAGHSSAQTAPDVDAAIFDGAVIVNMLKPGNVKTYQEYVDMVFMPFIYSQLLKVNRLDVVWDRYFSNSIKGLARTKRGVAFRQQVTASAPIPPNWQDFLRNDENKTGLFCFLAEQMFDKPVADSKLLIGTHDVNVKCSLSNYNTSKLEPCTQEEADTRMLLHAADMVSAGYRKLLVRTVDTDVVVLAVAFFHEIRSDQLWIALGTGQHFRYIPVHELAVSLGPQRSCALPVFHAVSGCDTVSAFVGRGKKTCWEIWKKCPEVTKIFAELFNMPETISDNCLTVLQRFVVRLYDVNCTCDSVNVARKKLFSSKGKSIENIPPTLDALQQHIRRAVYQAGYVWSQSLSLQPQLPSPTDWGWHLVDTVWHPVWMTIPDAAKCCPELKRCGCKSGCVTKRCKCVKDNIPCTALCACDGECRQ